MPQEQPGMFGIPPDGATPAPAINPAQPQGQPAEPAPVKPGSPAPAAPATPQAAPTEPGSPASTDPAKPAPETTTQGSPDDRSKAYQRHLQTRYQKAMEYLADKHPAVREELNTVLATSPQSGTRQDDYGSLLPAPKPPTPGASGASLRDAAPDPLEDPQGYAMYVAQLTAAEYRKLAQAEAATQRKQSQDYQLQIEAAEVEREVNAFISPKGEPHAPDYFSGVPGDVVAEAANIVVNVYGIPIDRPGGPTRRFHAFVNEVKRIMSERNMNQRQTELAGQASQQAGQVMKMAVPSAVGAVTPGDKSPEKKHLESMMGVSGTALSDLMQKPG